jgi:hypothetical protein
MRRRPAILATCATLVLAFMAAALATSTYDYKPHEYALVDGGLAPNNLTIRDAFCGAHFSALTMGGRQRPDHLA